MYLLRKLFRSAVASVAVAASVATISGTVNAQEPAPLPPVFQELPSLLPENGIEPASGFGRSRVAPGAAPCYPCPPIPCPPGQQLPGMGDPMQPPITQPPAQQPGFSPDFGDLGRGADLGPLVGQNGYIENAVPVTMARLRFDSAYGSNRPDRGGFFYPKCGCFRNLPPDATPEQRRNAIGALGPPLQETNVDYQELIVTAEYAFNRRMSAFFDIPVRFINPDMNQNASGISDISFGGKYAFLLSERRVMSLMMRFQAPAGSLSRGLGNGSWWMEPGLLYLEQLSDKWQFFGEFRYLYNLGQRSDFTGSLLRYGVGSSYVVAQGCWGYVAPVLEFVGWTVLTGKELNPELGAVSASGDTIVNAKFGLRVGLGAPQLGTAYPTRSDLYIGYGRALTGEVWYKDMLRLEYRRFF